MKYLILTFLFVAAGCGFDDVDEPVETRETKPSLTWGAGAVAVEYRPDVSEGLMVHAQFLLATNLNRDAAFEALEIWSPDQELDEDACTVSSMGEFESDEPTLRLLSVNEITVETENKAFQLAERRLPNAISTISGVVYGNDEGFDQDEIFIPYEPGSSYLVQAEGSAELAGFEVELVAPSAVLFDTIGGELLDEDRSVLVSSDDDLVVTWDNRDVNADIFLELAGEQTMTCRLANDGEFVVPARLLSTVGSSIDAALRTVSTRSIFIENLGPTEFVIGTVDDATISID